MSFTHRIHSFLGLWCSIILAFIFLTGTLSVFANEIDWLLNDKMRTSAEGREKVSLAQTFGAAQKTLEGRLIYRVYRSDDPWVADLVEFAGEGGRRQLWIDPYTSTANGETGTTSFYSIIAELHTRLFIPGRPGLMVVTVFSLALSAAVIAGILLLPRFWGSFLIRPRFGGSPRALTSDLHRLGGAWALPFVILICLTALYYFAETLKLAAPPLDTGVNTERRETKLPDDLDEAKIAKAIDIAKETYPELKIKHILFPDNRVQPIRIEGHLTATLVRERANTVYLHPDTLEVTRAHRGEELSAHQRISEAVDPLHWGYWGGLWSKALWFLFGSTLTAMPVLGAIIFAKRMGVRRAKLEGRAIGDLRVYWDGMGLGKWGALGLVAIGLGLMLKSLLM